MNNPLSNYGLPIVLSFVVVEWVVSFFLNDKKYDSKESFANIATGVLGKLLNGFIFSTLAYAAYAFANQHALFQIEMTVSAWIAIVLLVDFAWYIEHRAGHESRLGWAIHSVHHSSTSYNYTVALRLPWFGPLMRIPFLLPLAFLGFPPVAIFVGYSFVFIYQIWIHTQYVGKLGWFDRYFNSPSNHRAHHGSNKIYHDKNFGGITVVWDRLFGTYEPETVPVVYGISEPVNTFNPVAINFDALVALAKDVHNAGSLSEMLLLPVKGPGWKFKEKV